MQELNTIARPYAQAALAQAVAEQKLAEWSEALAFLAAAVRDPALAAVVGNPAIDDERLTALMLAVAEGRISETVGNFLKLLVHNQRLPALGHIAAQFETGRAELEGRRHVEVVSAFEMSDAQKKTLSSAVAKRLGRDVDVQVSVDDTLLGGVVIRAGDMVIDASMRGRLAQLASALGAAA